MVDPGSLPHWVEAPIINFYKWAGCNLLAQIEPKSLQEFQAPRSERLGLGYLICLELRIARVRDPFEPGLCKNHKPVRVRLLPVIDGLFQHFSITSCKDHHHLHVLPIHHW